MKFPVFQKNNQRCYGREKCGCCGSGQQDDGNGSGSAVQPGCCVDKQCGGSGSGKGTEFGYMGCNQHPQNRSTVSGHYGGKDCCSGCTGICHAHDRRRYSCCRQQCGQHSAQCRSGRNAHQTGIGQRVAEKTLKHSSGSGQQCTADSCQYNPWQPDVAENYSDERICGIR